MTHLLLHRYGLPSVLCVDDKPSTVKSGQADGLQPRTLEVLQSLDLAHEIVTQGCRMYQVAFWNPTNDGKGPGILRTDFVDDVSVPSRFPHEVTIHQGRIERILNEDLERRGGYVERGWKVVGWEFDYQVEDWPVRVEMVEAETGKLRRVRCKYLVGGDGARSVVRKGMGETLVGDHTDHVW